jgi:hypothetical protein
MIDESTIEDFLASNPEVAEIYRPFLAVDGVYTEIARLFSPRPEYIAVTSISPEGYDASVSRSS